MLKWRFMNTGARDGAWNMAVDEVLWRRVREKRSPPTVRLYAWAPATLSVGYGQSIERDIDPRALRRHAKRFFVMDRKRLVWFSLRDRGIAASKEIDASRRARKAAAARHRAGQ